MNYNQTMYNNNNQTTLLQSSPMTANVFTGVYISSEQEVASAPVPMDGTSTILVDVGNNKLYVKKMQNGVPTVNIYAMQPIFNVAAPPVVEEPKQDPMVLVLEQLKLMQSDIDSLKAKELPSPEKKETK